MMQGFGVNTFVLVNDKNERTFVKFHFTPELGVHSLVWDEAVKIAGADPDFHRSALFLPLLMTGKISTVPSITVPILNGNLEFKL
jgi:catalase